MADEEKKDVEEAEEDKEPTDAELKETGGKGEDPEDEEEDDDDDEAAAV